VRPTRITLVKPTKRYLGAPSEGKANVMSGVPAVSYFLEKR
jgi:hypothetical protein